LLLKSFAFQHARLIGHGRQFSGYLPLMEDPSMPVRVESFVIPTHE
jgi:hypothetical protein